MPLDLDKKIDQLDLGKAPVVLNLAKKAAPLIEAAGLGNQTARVGLVIDASGSMEPRYLNKQVQQLMNRAAALAALLDDNGQLEVFPFHNSCRFYGSLPPVEASTAVEAMIRKTGYGGTNYGAAFEAVEKFYWPNSGRQMKAVVDDQPPVYLIFVTDGATEDQQRAMEAIRMLSFRPCFIQCISLGQDYDSNKAAPKKSGGLFGGLFGGGGGSSSTSDSALDFLVKLDDELKGTHVDAFDFFGTKDAGSLPDEEFFRRMMGEFPTWLKNPKVQAMMKTQAPSAGSWG